MDTSTVTNAINAVSKAITSIFTYLSADERRKRRRLQLESRVLQAINLAEKHFDTLDDFMDKELPALLSKDLTHAEKKIVNRHRHIFRKTETRFKKLT